MRRLALAFALLLVPLAAVPAVAQTTTGVLDRVSTALKSDPVYVDPQAERGMDSAAADGLRRRIRSKDTPIFVAVLPGAATSEAGGNVNELPTALANRVGLAGTYAVVAGNSFRAGSNTLRAGVAPAAATAAFQAHSSEGIEAVLTNFVDRVGAAAAGQSSRNGTGEPQAGDQRSGGGGEGGGEGGGGGSGLLPLVLLLGAGGAGLYFWQRGKRQKEEAEARVDAQRDRSVLQAELSVLAEDVLALEPQLALHPDARADYDAAAARFRVAQAALEQADDRIDLVRVERVIAEGQYAMSRARAIIDGREPPPPPADLSRPGRRDEPAVDLDEEGQPMYRGYGAPWYGGGWFGGGGGGLLTGLFLGQMLGGWGGGHHEHNVYVDNGGGGEEYGGGGEIGGGDWGGGDWGGGGDFGGGDVGGGDW